MAKKPMELSFFLREAAAANFTDGRLSGTGNPSWDGMPPGLHARDSQILGVMPTERLSGTGNPPSDGMPPGLAKRQQEASQPRSIVPKRDVP